MRRIGQWTTAAIMAVACLALQARAGDDKKDKELLQGSWEVVSMVFKGMELPKTKDKEGEIITFKGDKAIAKRGGKDDPAGFKLDASKKPKEIDIMAEKGLVKGIYELTADSLKIAFSDDEGVRPKAFSGDNVITMTLKKKKS